MLILVCWRYHIKQINVQTNLTILLKEKVQNQPEKMKDDNDSKLMETDKSLLCETDKQNITNENNMADFLFSSIALPVCIEIETKFKKFSAHFLS